MHAINNTALVAAALYAFDGDFSGGISAVVQGGLDTDTNGAAVGSILGALAGPGGIDERWSAPLQRAFRELASGLRRDHDRRARAENARSRRRTGHGVSIPLEKPRDPLVPRPIDLPAPVPLDPDA